MEVLKGKFIQILMESVHTLAETWKSVLSQYSKKMEFDSKKEGPGISVFVMRREPKKGIFNCQYVYMGQGDEAWNQYMKMSEISDKIEKIYDPSKMYLASVQIPDIKDQTVGNIRAFLYDTHCEVDLYA